MGNDPKAIATPTEGGQPSGQPSAQPEAGYASQPEYVTRAEALQIAKDAAEAARREMQSHIDKGQKKVREGLAQLEQTIKMQEGAGVQFTDEQKAKMRQTVMEMMLTEDEQPLPNSVQQPSPAEEPEGDEELDPVTLEAWQLMDDAGVEIVEGDPEFQTLDYSTPSVFIASVKAAIDAKSRRLAPQNPEARIPGLGGGGAPASVLPDGIPPIQRLNEYFRNKK